MQLEMKAVAEFHEKYGLLSSATLCDQPYDDFLEGVGLAIVLLSRTIEMTRDLKKDARALRAHLEIEELGEKLIALARSDEVQALDATTDQLYVLVGTACTYDWPLEEAFAEVHRSNMTKKRKSDDGGRVRDKGDQFVPPNLMSVLMTHRSRGSCKICGKLAPLTNGECPDCCH